MKLNRLSLSVMLMGASFAVTNVAHASGYHFGTQSVSAQATANSSAAEAKDASTIFYNAAGLTKLEGIHLSGTLNLVMPSVKYKNAMVKYPTGGAVQGQTSGRISDDIVPVPHAYASYQVNDQVFLGLGVYVPFASSTEYNRNSVLRYNLNQTKLQTMDIQPTIAFKANDQHSVAVGLVAQHAAAELRQYANFGYALGARVGGPAAGAAMNGKADGYAEVEGDDWGLGYTLSWMWDVNNTTRFGVNYRSHIKHTLQGDADWTMPVGATPAATTGLARSGFKDEKASLAIVTPESLSIHGMIKADDKTNVFGDVTWTRHSRFDRAQLVYENAKTGQGNTTYLYPNWKDTYKFSLGASHQYNDMFQIRAGVAYDKTPVKSADFRLATMPDNNRTWFSLGGNYALNKQMNIDVAYSYIHIQNATANVDGTCKFVNNGQPCVSSQTKGSADFKSNANILGVQLNYKF